MAFTVEDGTGVADANAYAAIAYVDTYHSDRGNTDWTGVDAVKQAAIIKATDYIDRRFVFKGVKEFTTNDLAFPRTYLYDRGGNLVEGIPAKLAMAVAEYARIALSQELFQNPVIDETGLRRIALREKVGPIETETKYAETNQIQILKPYPVADRLLSEFILDAGRAIR